MRLVNMLLAVSVTMLLGVGVVFAAEEDKASETAKKVADKVVSNVDEVVVTVAGHAIKESDVQGQLDKMIAQQSQRRKLSDAESKMFRTQARSAAIEGLVSKAISEYVLSEEAKKANIKVEDKDLDAKVDEMMDYLSLRQNMPRKDLEAKIAQGQGMSFDEFIKKQKANPEFVQMVLLDKMAVQQSGDDLKVSDKDVEEYYKKNLEGEFSEAEQVRASHILIDIRKLKTDEEKAAAKKKAEELCAEAKKPGADFAKLAKENSACPSSAKGGDLGFFTKEKMVAPFSDAAFAMEKGGVSDVVETQFGYHVIKVTDKKPAKVVSQAEAKDKIRANMLNDKKRKVTGAYYDELKKKANIVYSAKDKKADKDKIVIK